MSNPTTPFGWQMPTATDLVTDLPADFEVFGQAVATSMGDLLGGTTGQVLSKASNTDMDFVWSADAAGMANPMTTTGDTIYSSPGSTPARLGIGSTGQGLSVVAGIPAWTASATSTLTTTGDTLYASAANTLARRAVGTTGQVLTVTGGVPTWETPAAGGGMTLLSTTTLSGASVTISSISQGYTNLCIFIDGVTNATGDNYFFIDPNGSGTLCWALWSKAAAFNNSAASHLFLTDATGGNPDRTSADNSWALVINNYASTTAYKSYSYFGSYRTPVNLYPTAGWGQIHTTSGITSLKFQNGGGDLSTGKVLIYGVK